MKQYLDLLETVMSNGQVKEDRTGTGTISVFGHQMRFDLSEGFPLLTTKKVHLKSIIHELLWMLSGDTNIKYLADNKVSIWDDWPFKKFSESAAYNGETMKEFAEMIRNDDAFAKKWGELGPVYGYQWRNFESNGNVVDQIKSVMKSLKENPDSRRHIVSAWNPARIDEMALPPCHAFFQFYVVNNKLSCQLYQRSADIFLGVPFNIAFYSLLTMMMAETLGYEYGDFVHTLGDAHIYSNHFDQVKTQLSRDTRALPTMKICRRECLLDYTYDDFTLEGYDPHPRIKAAVAV